MRWLVLAAFLALAAWTWQFTPDDTYISLVYAQNLPHLGMNPGEVYEGYSCPLWIGVLYDWAYPVVAKTLSMAAAGLCVALWPILAAIPWMPMHGVSGMETALAMLAAGATVAMYRRRLWAFSALSMLCLCLLRPEAVLAAPLLMIRRRARLEALVLCLIPLAAYWIARWAYFGTFLPAPIWAKLHGAPAFNYGYRYEMPVLAALAAAWTIRPRHAAIAVLIALPLTLRASMKARDYADGLERGYGAVAALVNEQGIGSVSIDTPGLVAYRTKAKIIDQNGIAASSDGEATLTVHIRPFQSPGSYQVNNHYHLELEYK